MDVLADVLAATRIQGMIFADSELRPPWGLRFDRSGKAGFHIVRRGTCFLRVQNRPPLQLVQGDVVLLSQGWTHALCDKPDREARPYPEALAENARRRAGEPGARLLCGAYGFDGRGPHPLVSLLPPILHLPAEVTDGSGELQAVVRLLTAEVEGRRPGYTAASARLVDLLFLFIVRGWLARQPEGTGGWLGALRDPQVGRALALLHERVAHPWTVEELGQAVAASRATLARRFAQLVGEPPLAYLTRWRMTLAAQRLRDTDRSLAEIAAEVGYQSEFALGKAFKRLRGLAPGEYRRAARAA